MGLNPFKESNLNDLQQRITKFFSYHFDGIVAKTKYFWEWLIKKGNERITVMFIPHSEKKIINFHISIFAISTIVLVFALTITITSILIINHSSTIKEVSKLKQYGTNSKLLIKKYQEEISQLYVLFQKFKPEITQLYSLTPESDSESLWARGGASNTEYSHTEKNSPPMEILNLQEIENELKTTKSIIHKIKRFVDYRRKILENTPSTWPVNGFIISRFGQISSPNNFEKKYHSGIDIEAFPGTEIRATAPGKVSDIRWDPVLGLTISIEHKYGFITTYSHCQRVSISAKQMVSKNEVIGYVGKTGKTTRYICYYQIMIGTEHVDPLPYLNKITR